MDVKMTLTSPGCPVGPQLIGGVQTYVNRAYPDLDAINVHVVWTPMWDAGNDDPGSERPTGVFLIGDRGQEAGIRWPAAP